MQGRIKNRMLIKNNYRNRLLKQKRSLTKACHVIVVWNLKQLSF